MISALGLFDLSCVRWLAALLFPQGYITWFLLTRADQGCLNGCKWKYKTNSCPKNQKRHTNGLCLPVFLFHSQQTVSIQASRAIRGQWASSWDSLWLTPPQFIPLPLDHCEKKMDYRGLIYSSLQRAELNCSLGALWSVVGSLDHLEGEVPDSSNTTLSIMKRY